MNDFHITLKCKQIGSAECSFDDLHYCFSRQYERDSFFCQQQGALLLFIGVCYNKSDIIGSGDKKEWQDILLQSFRKDSKKVLEEIDGYFCGLFYDSKAGELLLFSDHLSTLPIYYYRNNDYFIADTDIFRLVHKLHELGIRINLSEFGAYSMLAYSFMLGNNTLLSDVYKVCPASLYSFKLNQTQKYFEYYSEEKDMVSTSQTIAEGIDFLFSHAVTDSMSVDGGGQHLFTLSGGLDSRMYLLYALHLGYKDITTLNYSQTFYREEVIAKRIAADCGCEHIFFSLDNGHYLSNIDEGIRATQGMTTYRPILSARMVWNQLNMNRYNVVHTGLLGDAIIGGYCIDKCNTDDRFHSETDLAVQLNVKNKTILRAPYAKEFDSLFNQILDWIPTSKLTSLGSEKFVLDNRYINGLMQSSLGTRDISVLVSPYTSKKMMKYIFSFPSSLRLNHNLYFEWMNKYMPIATKYTWENTGLRPMYGKIPLKPHSAVASFAKKMEDKFRFSRPESSRNPYNFWMKNNENIQQEIYDYCVHKLFLLEKYPELLDISRRILKYNNIYLLIRLATLLGFLYMCFLGGESAVDGGKQYGQQNRKI